MGDVLRIGPDGAVVAVEDGHVDINDDGGRLLRAVAADAPGRVEVQLLPVPPAVDDATAAAVRATSLALITQVGANATATQQRVADAFDAFRRMTTTMFVIGVLGFVATLVRGLTADSGSDAATTAVIGGLSATAFVATFLQSPVRDMGAAGLKAAWLQAVVNTYWTKLGYLHDTTSVVADLDAAQTAMDRSFVAYLHATGHRAGAADGAAGGAADGAVVPAVGTTGSGTTVSGTGAGVGGTP